MDGRAIAQAVSRCLPTGAARVPAQVSHVGFVTDKVTLGHVFSEYFGFPCQLLFHQMIHTHLRSGADIIGQIVADVPSGLSLSHHPKKLKKCILSRVSLDNATTINVVSSDLTSKFI
jgi:hypothetical protein